MNQPFYELCDGHKTVVAGIRMVQSFINTYPRKSIGLTIFNPKLQTLTAVIDCETKDIPAVCHILSLTTGKPIERFGYIPLQNIYSADIDNRTMKPGCYDFKNGELVFNEAKTNKVEEKRMRRVIGTIFGNLRPKR